MLFSINWIYILKCQQERDSNTHREKIERDTEGDTARERREKREERRERERERNNNNKNNNNSEVKYSHIVAKVVVSSPLPTR